MLGLPNQKQIREGVAALAQRITPLVSAAYGTTMSDGQPGTITHTFRVASANCGACGHRNRLYPHAMVTLLARKERGRPEAILACRNGHLSHGRHDRNSRCRTCRTIISPTSSYTARRVSTCSNCGHRTRLQDLATSGDWLCLQGFRGAGLARDRLSLSRSYSRSVNHPPEATETPIEIQLSTLRKTLGDDLVRDLEDSVAPNTWRAYRSDLADFATWVAYTSTDWRAPEVVATYLRTLEDGGAAYATITRRLTSIHKLVGYRRHRRRRPRLRGTPPNTPGSESLSRRSAAA